MSEFIDQAAQARADGRSDGHAYIQRHGIDRARAQANFLCDQYMLVQALPGHARDWGYSDGFLIAVVDHVSRTPWIPAEPVRRVS